MGFFCRLLREQRGTTALEMAFVGPAFLLILLAILDVSLLVATQSMMNGAARDAGRLIRTGQAQNTASAIATFQNQLCSELSALVPTATCQSNVLFQVQVFGTFGAVSFAPCNYNNNQPGSGTACQFTPGNGGQIVGVQASYARPFLVPWVGACLSGGACWTGIGTSQGSAGTGSVNLIATVVFQNEPFT
jgi:Flp pilus assembly protein TadG